MSTKDLRSLAKDYAKGILSKEDYRNHRTNLFNGIISGEVQVEEHDFAPPIDTETGDSTVETMINFQISSAPKTENSDTKIQVNGDGQQLNYKLFITGGVISLACLIVLFSLILNGSGKQAELNTENEQQVDYSESVSIDPQQPDIVESEFANSLIHDFLSKNNWGNESLEAFVRDWQYLSVEDQAAGIKSASMRRLNNAIYQQFQEQKALLILGDDASVLEKQRALVSFAQQLGIHDTRLQID